MDEGKAKQLIKMLLRKNGLKVTMTRVALLSVLMEKQKPLSVDVLKKFLKQKAHITTLYRSLEQLSEKGIIEKTNFGDTKTYFEYQHHHHHHITCTSCGIKEETSLCVASLLPRVIKKSKNFKDIQNHTLELFGTCHTCSRI